MQDTHGEIPGVAPHRRRSHFDHRPPVQLRTADVVRSYRCTTRQLERLKADGRITTAGCLRTSRNGWHNLYSLAEVLSLILPRGCGRCHTCLSKLEDRVTVKRVLLRRRPGDRTAVVEYCPRCGCEWRYWSHGGLDESEVHGGQKCPWAEIKALRATATPSSRQ